MLQISANCITITSDAQAKNLERRMTNFLLLSLSLHPICDKYSQAQISNACILVHSFPFSSSSQSYLSNWFSCIDLALKPSRIQQALKPISVSVCYLIEKMLVSYTFPDSKEPIQALIN